MPDGSSSDPFDYVLVGAGTAGSALAKLLSDDNKTSVLVLEAGENQGEAAGVLQGEPFGDLTLPNNPDFSFARSASVGDVNAPNGFLLSSGRMWGGSSGQTNLLAVRGTPDAYATWGAIDSKWSYFNLLGAMKVLETYTPDGPVPNPTERGFAGPLYITQDTPLPTDPFYTALAAAANAPLKMDYNDSFGDIGTVASQWFATPLNPGRRSWAQSAFLPSTVVDPGGTGIGDRRLQIRSNSTAIRVLFSDRSTPHAIGVRYIEGKDPTRAKEVFAKKKIILTAGTVGDATLLQLSGIGPKSVLESAGIPVVVDNANVGENLQIAYGIYGLIGQGEKVAPPDQVAMAFIDLSGTNISQPKDGIRRAQLLTRPNSSFVPHAIVTANGLANTRTTSFLVYNLRPNARGTVTVLSDNPLTPPKIELGLYKDAMGVPDISRMTDAYKVIANIAMAYNATMPIYPPPAHYPAPWGPAVDNALLEQDAKDSTLQMTVSPTGSCKMAPTAATGVVDGNLDVFGVRGLSIASLSVAPQMPTGNTVYAAYLIGMTKAKIEGATVPF